MTRPSSSPGPTATHQAHGIHVTVTGTGPDVLLLHGTGSTGDSWQAMVPSLARCCRVIVPDLPGHGRSVDPGRGGFSPAAMGRALLAMLHALDAQPSLLVGHSAGAALAATLVLDDVPDAVGMVAIAPAMLGFGGGRQPLFSGLAKLLSMNPLVPQAVAWRARDRSAVARLLEGIGTDLDAAGLARYTSLFRRPEHVAAVLKMMAQWDLAPLERRLPLLEDRVLLITGSRDRAVPEGEIIRLQRRLPRAARIDIDAAGHLVHEERPEAVLAAVRSWAAGRGLML